MERVAQSFVNSFTSKLEEPVRQHLKNVYACLTLTTLASAAGAYAQMKYIEILGSGLFTALLALGFLIALMVTPDNGKNRQMRIGFLTGFGFCTGLGMGPLISLAIQIDPSIIITAMTCTAMIFVSFSIASLTARRGYWLFLGGTLMTLLTSLCVLSLANLFFGSRLLFQANVYLGLGVMCLFVVYDTQMIVEKRRNGSKDFVIHSVDLFIDLIGIFKRIVIILLEKEERNRKKQKD